MIRFARFVRFQSSQGVEEAKFFPSRTPGVPGLDFKRHSALLAAAGFAIAWVIARASLQSVTLDESDSYLAFTAADWPAYWYPAATNHVLNTILQRIITNLFGLSPLTLRAPALIGAAIYIASSYALCLRVSSRNLIRVPLFLCLVYNPFVMDYLVAARGYSLALGFLMAAIWAALESRFFAASLCAGLSFCANFSFALADAAVMSLIAVWAVRQTKNWRTLLVLIVPGAVAAFLISGSTVWSFPKSQLYYGAFRLIDTWKSMASASFDELNPFLVNPLLAPILGVLGRWLPNFLYVVLLWQMLRIVWAGDQLGLILSRAIAITLACHWLAFHLFGIPLPMSRTALFFVPMALLVIGIGAALPSVSRLGTVSRFASLAVLILSAIYFLGCLRLSHFKEWKFDADVQDVYRALENAQDRYHFEDVEVDWRYANPLNFYRAYFHDQRFARFHWTEPHTEGKAAYVLYSPVSQDFIRKQNLEIIYRGNLSDAVIAVRAPQQPAIAH